jgi:signal transduction histidine kinase
LFPFLGSVFTGVLGMLLNMPVLGALGITIFLYLALVIFVPWDKPPLNKLKIYYSYLISAIICFLIVFPFWGRLISIFPNPYKQLLRTGTATIEVVVSSNENREGQCMAGTCARLLLAKGQEVFLTMDATTEENKQTGNDEILYRAVFNDATGKAIGKPIHHLANAEYAKVRFEEMPPKSKIIRGLAVFTFNGFAGVEIPILPQTTTEERVIIIETEKYLKLGFKE